jgi:hypothetical protein
MLESEGTMKTAQDLMQTCELILQAKADNRKTCKVGGVDFSALLYPDAANNGWCQRTARLAYKAATGQAMPGASCCAGATCANLLSMGVDCYDGPWDASAILPGDFLYFGGKPVHSCGHEVGHVGIWLGKGRMFQHTSRGRLAITQSSPTASQRSRFIAAFRLLPQAKAKVAKPAGPTLVLPGGLTLTEGLTIVGDRLHAPVALVAAALGAEVEWEAASKTATVRVDDPE